MKKTRLGVLAGAALVVALVGLWLFVRSGDRPTVPPPQPMDVPDAKATAPRAAGETSPVARLPALPPAGATMAQAAATLQQLADAGDAQAACRLSIELLRCRQRHPFGQSTMDNPVSGRQLYAAEEERLAAEGDLEGANRAAALLMAYTELESDCAGVQPALDARAEHYLRQAALAGAREARIRYASGETTGLHGNTFGHLLSPEFDAWRREAPRLVQQAFEQGEPEALLLVLPDQHGGFSNFGMLEPPSPTRDLARLLLAKRIFGNDPALARFERKAAVDHSIQRAAQAQAADWHLRHFKGATAKLSDHTASLTFRFSPSCKMDDGDCGWPTPTAHAVPDCVVGPP